MLPMLPVKRNQILLRNFHNFKCFFSPCGTPTWAYGFPLTKYINSENLVRPSVVTSYMLLNRDKTIKSYNALNFLKSYNALNFLSNRDNRPYLLVHSR